MLRRFYNMPLLKNVIKWMLGQRTDLLRFAPVNPENRLMHSSISGTPPECMCLVAAKTGLYLWEPKRLVRFLKGDFYGLSFYKGHWYAYQQLYTRGRLIRFKLSEGQMLEPKQLLHSLSRGCHQIDFLDDDLYVTDTYNNRLLILSVDGEKVTTKSAYYPAGELVNGRQSQNYVHMNSVWRGEDTIYVFFHNETTKTERPSEIVRLDKEFSINERIPINGSNGHNVILFKDKIMFCDSQGGALVWGDEPVFECEFFTRGLSITDNFLIVGGSEYGDRNARYYLKGSLHFLDHDFRSLSSATIPGLVQEVRCVSHADYSLSNCGRIKKPTQE